MTQTLAIFMDAYRELNARKLFWFTLIISGLVVAIFAMLGINENGVRLLFWDIEAFGITSRDIPPDQFYKGLFVHFGIGFWLAWLAAILALVSTASMFPDFVSGGSIDLVLSKPIGRLRLFLTKYAAGLLFVTLQVTVFAVASFLVIGLRGGVWEPGLLLSIPIVVVFFSYLFCVCAVLGIITRSTIAALMLTLLFWFLIFVIHTTEQMVLLYKIPQEMQQERIVMQIEIQERTLEGMRDEPTTDEQAIERAERRLDDRRAELELTENRLRTLGRFHTATYAVKTVLPKTTETTDLLTRWLVEYAELPEMDDDHLQDNRAIQVHDPRVQQEMMERVHERSVFWIIGTSLLFEVFVLMIGAWIFCRRDF